MAEDNEFPNEKGEFPVGIDRVGDLIEFYHNWSIHRRTIVKLANNPGINKKEKTTLEWMLRLVDRGGKRDLE